jgi:hypothetical protein
MRKLSLAFYFVLLSLFLGAQNNTVKLEELQQALDVLQYGIGNGDTVRYRKIDVEIDILKKRNDSLILQQELLKLELLLLQAKLSACEDNRNSLEMILATEREMYDVNRDSLENFLENEKALFFSKVSIDEEDNLVGSSLKKGLYVVLASFRKSVRTKIQLKNCLAQYHSLRLIVAQNHSKTWFHVCIDDPFTKEESVEKVFKARKRGFKNAWAIILN